MVLIDYRRDEEWIFLSWSISDKFLIQIFLNYKICEEVVITSKLLDITMMLAKNNVSFSVSLNFTKKDKEFQFSASSSKKDQDQPILQNKRKKSLSQRTRNLKRLLEYKEKKRKN